MAGGSFCSVISLASPSRVLGRKTVWLTFVSSCACLALQRHVEVRLYTVNSMAVFSIPVMVGLMMQGSSELADKPGRSLPDALVSPGPYEYRGKFLPLAACNPPLRRGPPVASSLGSVGARASDVLPSSWSVFDGGAAVLAGPLAAWSLVGVPLLGFASREKRPSVPESPGKVPCSPGTVGVGNPPVSFGESSVPGVGTKT